MELHDRRVQIEYEDDLFTIPAKVKEVPARRHIAPVRIEDDQDEVDMQRGTAQDRADRQDCAFWTMMQPFAP
eukprot:15218512-Alexandrium_andersonii.AAC.1